MRAITKLALRSILSPLCVALCPHREQLRRELFLAMAFDSLVVGELRWLRKTQRVLARHHILGAMHTKTYCESVKKIFDFLHFFVFLSALCSRHHQLVFVLFEHLLHGQAISRLWTTTMHAMWN